MAVDELRARYLRDRVLTATPAQRVVMLYDRLSLDLTMADGSQDVEVVGAQLSHAMQVVAELRTSLDLSAGGPADNLASIYGFLIGELIEIRGGDRTKLPAVQQIVQTLRTAWVTVAEQTVTTPGVSSTGAWVG